MRVLYVDDYAQPGGGVATYLNHVIPAIEAAGHLVAFCGTKDADEKLRARSVCTYGRPVLPETAYTRALTNRRNAAGQDALQSAVQRFCPDLVHLGGCTAALGVSALRALEGVPIVYTAHNYELVSADKSPVYTRPHGWPDRMSPEASLSLRQRPLWKRPADALLQKSMAAARSRISQVITPCSRMAAVFEEAGWPCVLHLPHGIPLGRAFTGERACIALSVGRLSQEKGPQVLIEAAPRILERVPDCVIWLAGEGPMADDLAERAQHLGVGGAVRFLGRVPHADVLRLHAQAGVLVVPSICEESFGLVVAEALAWGTPAVASEVGGHLDLIRHGQTGLLFRPFDVEGLVDGVGRILLDPHLGRRLADAGRRFAENELPLELHVSRLVEVYQAVLERHESGLRPSPTLGASTRRALPGSG